MENKIVKNPMGHENILPLLLKMSFPAMLSMLIQSLYNITDSYFVAQISEKALRATSISYPVQIIIVGFAVGTGVGINSFISRSLGEEDEKKANQGAMHGLLLIFVSYVFFLVFRLFLMDNFIARFTTDPEVMLMTKDYLGLVTGFAFLAITQITIEKLIQGTGNMVIPMIIQLMGAITNIILDPIMIFGLFGFPAMGIRGAAIATLIGQGAGAAVGLIFLFRKKSILHIDYRIFKFSKKIIKDIYKVGFPSILMQSVTAFVTTVLNLIIIRHSEMAVSILGIYFKLESFILMPVFGLGQGVLPLIGYNYGARKKERIRETHKYGIILATLIMIVGTFLFQVFPEKLLSIFAENQEMVDLGVHTLRRISLGFAFAATGIINSVYFQGLGLGKFSLLITALRQIVLIIPLAYFLSNIGLDYVWFAYPIAEIFAFGTSIILQKKADKQYVEIL